MSVLLVKHFFFSAGTSVGQVSAFNKSSGVVSVSTDSEELSSSYKESDKLMSGTVFFEIVDPKPRWENQIDLKNEDLILLGLARGSQVMCLVS